jgi:hypothetical protein
MTDGSGSSTPAAEIEAFVAQVTPARRHRDAQTLLDLFSRATGATPKLWGSIVGYGQYHYRYDSGREGDAPAAGFAPRKSATTIYLVDGVSAHPDLLERLGPHRSGVGYIYLTDLEQNDLGVLEELVRACYTKLTAGTYTLRARDGSPD